MTADRPFFMPWPVLVRRGFAGSGRGGFFDGKTRRAIVGQSVAIAEFFLDQGVPPVE
ncbi:MAG: hypothetical protein ACKOHG_20010 [Planctomycetia bacterium]